MISTDDALLALLERTVRQQRLFKTDDTIIVAISGGADSTALLDLLGRLPDHNLQLVAAHLNHCLRGSDSDADEEFCRQSAARYAIPFETRRIDVRGAAVSGRLNLEDAGRRARIAFLDHLREKYGATTVALAHHADDQAETVLMRLLRGSGMTGLSGMAYRNAHGYVRPLLEISRAEIEQYLRRRGLNWCEDASNSDTSYLRNRIRHNLLPILEEYNPAIRSTLAATASVLADDETLLAELAEQAFDESCRMEEDRIVCNAGQLSMLGLALQRRVVRLAFKQLAGNLERVTQRHVAAVCALLASDRPNSRLALPQGITAIRAYDRLVFRHAPGAVPDRATELLITGPGHYRLPRAGSFAIEISEPPADFRALPASTAFFDLDKAPFPWLVRSFRPGDRIRPLGMSGRKKVKDVFIDRKIPFAERARMPLLFCGADLIWIAGVCVSELSRIDSSPAAVVRVTWQA